VASKGTTKIGEAFCMSCGAVVDPAAARCESCYSELDHDVKAFRCPRCDKLLELGTAECPKCSMKFRAKAVRPADRDADDRMLSRLIESEKAPRKGPALADAAPPALTDEEAGAVSGLLEGLAELAAARAEMSKRAEDARERLSVMQAAGAASISADALRPVLEATSEDLRSMAAVLSRARALSADVARAFSMPGPSRLAGGREMALAVPAYADGPATDESLTEREEQVRKREEMVDRKIKAYAQKKKELEEAEARAAPAPGAAAAPGADQEGPLGRRIRSVHEIISPDGACDDAEACLSSLEERVREIVGSRSELEQRVTQMEEGEEEVRALLKVLDGLLGQLPPDAVDRFSKTDEFKLYERVLDRLKI
jgi:DNA repair exonuclease SbcCD ATPase subunit